MKKDKKKKLIELYAEASTPKELFVDIIEKNEKIVEEIDLMKSRFDNVLDYVDQNKPKSMQQILKEVRPLIPKVKDGKTPTSTELKSLILPLIPKPKDGKDGNKITPTEVRDKLKELKGKERLSIFDLKDTEYLKAKGRDKIQWNSVGATNSGIGKVFHDDTLTGDGTEEDPLSVVGGSNPFDSHRPITTLPYVGQIINGDTVNEFLEAAFFGYAAPTISLSASPSQTNREKGDTISSVTLTATYVQMSSPVISIKFYRGATLIHTDSSPTGGTSVYVDSSGIADTTVYTAVVSDGTSTVTSNAVTYPFYYPFFYGVGDPGLDAAGIEALTKLIVPKQNNTTTTSPTNQVFYYAYLASYGLLTSILDTNGFETISDYTQRTVTITELDSSTQTYNVYEYNNLTTQSGFHNTYKF